jgi:hypothetical protein
MHSPDGPLPPSKGPGNDVPVPNTKNPRENPRAAVNRDAAASLHIGCTCIMLVSCNTGTRCCGNMLQVVVGSRGYSHCWRESASRPSTHRGDRHEDGCSLVSCSVVARSIRKRRRPGPFNAAAGCAATATECSAADRAAPDYRPGAAGPCTGATGPRASATERARTAAAACVSDATRFVGTAKSATAVVPSVSEVPVPLDAAVAAAAAVPFSDTGGTGDDAPSPSEAVWSAAVGALRIDGQ